MSVKHNPAVYRHRKFHEGINIHCGVELKKGSEGLEVHTVITLS